MNYCLYRISILVSLTIITLHGCGDGINDFSKNNELQSLLNFKDTGVCSREDSFRGCALHSMPVNMETKPTGEIPPHKLILILTPELQPFSVSKLLCNKKSLLLSLHFNPIDHKYYTPNLRVKVPTPLYNISKTIDDIDCRKLSNASQSKNDLLINIKF